MYNHTHLHKADFFKIVHYSGNPIVQYAHFENENSYKLKASLKRQHLQNPLTESSVNGGKMQQGVGRYGSKHLHSLSQTFAEPQKKNLLRSYRIQGSGKLEENIFQEKGEEKKKIQQARGPHKPATIPYDLRVCQDFLQ